MTDVEIIIKTLRLAWVSRPLIPGRKTWKTVPDYYLNIWLRCKYDKKYLDGLPSSY